MTAYTSYRVGHAQASAASLTLRAASYRNRIRRLFQRLGFNGL
jgi:hypothetical protein